MPQPLIGHGPSVKRLVTRKLSESARHCYKADTRGYLTRLPAELDIVGQEFSNKGTCISGEEGIDSKHSLVGSQKAVGIGGLDCSVDYSHSLGRSVWKELTALFSEPH
jgi:hypothetical protein